MNGRESMHGNEGLNTTKNVLDNHGPASMLLKL